MTPLSTPVGPIRPTDMLPDVLRRHPHLRPVFDRYGLHGCGGPNGPAETLEYFAAAHGVELPALLDELNAARVDPSRLPRDPPVAPNPLDALADSIYRRFFKAGVAVVLTAGATWGAYLLLQIGWRRAFTAISIHDVNAHGHAQIFGWVGLFVMGFAYQAFPRIRHTRLWRPDLANLSFYLMLFGIFSRALGEPLFHAPILRELAISGGLAELAAIGLFATVLLKTFHHSGKPYERHDAYILASLAFFLIQAVWDLGLLRATTAAPTRAALLDVVATYQTPLRDLQIHGFALLMILGVGLRMFPPLFGFAAPHPALVRGGLVAIVAGVVGEVCCFVLMRRTHGLAWAGATYAATLLVAGASIAVTARWGAFNRPAADERSRKFIRAAVVWLHLSMLLLVLTPLYLRVLLPHTPRSESGRQALAIGFSHAYAGAVRHAITVGFISLMILGMAAKVVPTLNGVDIRRLRPLWTPFVLVNLGCLLRVAFQVLTDLSAAAYPIAGLSGLLEVSGIAVWGVHLWRIMNGWQPAAAVDAAPPSRIGADDRVGWVVEWFPQLLPLLLAKGFAPLANPVFRRTMARAISIRTAAAHHRLDLDEFLTELNRAAFGEAGAAIGGPPPRRVSLPVLQHG